MAPITTPAIAPPDSDPESDDDGNGVEVAKALAVFGVVVAEVEAVAEVDAGLDVAVASADSLDAIAELLIAARDDAAIDDAAAGGTPAFGFTTPFAQQMLI